MIVTVLCVIIIGTAPVSFGQTKSPALATTMSIILPGVGHLYTNETGKGAALLGLYAGAMTFVVIYGPWTWEDEIQGDPFFSDLAEGTGTSGTIKAIWYGSAAVAAGTWLYAVLDAGPSAKRWNAHFTLLPVIDKDNVGIKLATSFQF
ncbi:hypothetical protein L0244_04470 [bacterium]|nr:hypothetical protein [bacterium]